MKLNKIIHALGIRDRIELGVIALAVAIGAFVGFFEIARRTSSVMRDSPSMLHRLESVA